MNPDRTKAPKFKLPDKISLPAPHEIKLPNGMPFAVINTGSADVLRFSIVFNAGTRYQQQILVAGTTLNMLAEGTHKYKSDKIAELLDFYGASVDVDIDRDWACVTVYSLVKHFEKALEIAEQIIKYPVFPQKELNIYKQNQKQQFIIGRQKVSTIAREAFISALFGNDHYYGVFADTDDYDKLKPEQLKHFHEKHYSSANAFAVASGKISETEINLISDYFGKSEWGNNQKNEPVQQKIAELPAKFIHIAKKNCLQSAIRMGKVLFDKKHPDYCGMVFLNTVLGGYFGSRLMKNIREEKAYTYGISSNVVCMRDSGYFSISTEAGNEYVKQTIEEIKNEILRLQQQKIAKNELSLVKNYITGDMLRAIDGAWKIADVYIETQQVNENFERIEKMFDEILKITPERVMDLANKYLDLNTLTTVISGRY